MKRPWKIFLIIIGVILLGVGLFLADAIYGNPLSKARAKQTVSEYITQTYPGTDFMIDDIFYNFKDGYYHAKVISPTSQDSHFDVAVSGKKIVFDTYNYDVPSGWNTWQRIDDEYRQMTDQVLEAEDFPLKSRIAFGTIVAQDDVATDDFAAPNYGIKLDELELDKNYDIKQLARETGQIIFYAEDEEVTFEKASELLLMIKAEFDQATVPFYAINFILEKPRKEDEAPGDDDFSIHTANFLYEDIYEEDLAKRIEQNHQLLMEYYKELDEEFKKRAN